MDLSGRLVTSGRESGGQVDQYAYPMGCRMPVHAKRTLGTSLAESEARAYLANLLRKYRLSPTLGNGLRSTQLPEWNALSLGRKRYVLWAGMRNVASEFLKAHLDEEAARRVLDREISRRCTWLVSRVQSGALDPTDFASCQAMAGVSR